MSFSLAMCVSERGELGMFATHIFIWHIFHSTMHVSKIFWSIQLSPSSSSSLYYPHIDMRFCVLPSARLHSHVFPLCTAFKHTIASCVCVCISDRTKWVRVWLQHGKVKKWKRNRKKEEWSKLNSSSSDGGGGNSSQYKQISNKIIKTRTNIYC